MPTSTSYDYGCLLALAPIFLISAADSLLIVEVCVGGCRVWPGGQSRLRRKSTATDTDPPKCPAPLNQQPPLLTASDEMFQMSAIAVRDMSRHNISR